MDEEQFWAQIKSNFNLEEISRITSNTETEISQEDIDYERAFIESGLTTEREFLVHTAAKLVLKSDILLDGNRNKNIIDRSVSRINKIGLFTVSAAALFFIMPKIKDMNPSDDLQYTDYVNIASTTAFGIMYFKSRNRIAKRTEIINEITKSIASLWDLLEYNGLSDEVRTLIDEIREKDGKS